MFNCYQFIKPWKSKLVQILSAKPDTLISDIDILPFLEKSEFIWLGV